MVHMIRDISGEAPVVDAVLEQITQRHCSVREAMNEDGLEQSFGVVNAPASSGDTKIKEKAELHSLIVVHVSYCAVWLILAEPTSP